jgi:hypothetical protein
MKRIVLFLLTNLAVMAVMSVVCLHWASIAI